MNRNYLVARLLLLSMIFLLCFSEVTLQTSLIFSRDLSLSPWIFRVGLFTPADYWLLAAATYLVYKYLGALAFPNGNFMHLVCLLFVYLVIGLMYNFLIYLNWKTYLYDIKAVLYIITPYLLLKNVRGLAFLRYLTPKYVLFYCVLAAVIDTGFTYLVASPEYPEFLNIPAYATIFDAGALFLWFLISKDGAFKLFIGFVLLVELVGLLNKLSLTPLYGVCYAIFYFLISKVRRYNSRVFGSMAVFYVFQIFIPLVLLFSPVGLMSEKSDGIVTRTIQWNNFLINASENFTGIVGKGLGSTWFEYEKMPSSDIYAVGTSMGDDVESSMALPVKFIFNFLPAGIFQKFGVIGCFFITYLICKACFKVSYIKSTGVYPGAAVVVLFLMLYYIPFVGFLRSAMIASIFFYWHEESNCENKFLKYW